MKKFLILAAMFLWTTHAHAMVLGVNWTGNEVISINDFPMLGHNYGFGLGLGGPVGNQAVGYKAFEFTVPEHTITNYLFVDATVVPDNWANPGEAAYSLPQGRDVTFRLYQGTRFFGPDHDYAAPDSLAFTSSTYNFSSVDSHTSRDYLNFQIPFNAELKSNNTYWLWAGTTGAEDHTVQGGSTFNYSTEFEGHHAPEPATMLLLGTGLAGIFLRKRKA